MKRQKNKSKEINKVKVYKKRKKLEKGETKGKKSVKRRKGWIWKRR
jgi:hypothetical protein